MQPPGRTRGRGRHGVIVALVWALVWLTAAAPRALAEEESSELDATTQARLEAIRERITELLAETPSDQREAVRRELLRVLETSEARSREAETTATETAATETTATETAATETAATETVVDRRSTRSTSEPASTETDIAATVPSAPAPSTPAPIVAPPVAPPPPSPPQRRARAPRCTTLLLFDENEDGKVNAQDRWWRHLYVWIDRNGDRQPQERELESVYERGVREIEAGLDGFYRKKGSLGEVRYDDTILFDLGGDGFGAGRRPDDGTLAVDATALRRGTGPSLESAEGSPLDGIQPFHQGQQLVFDDGRRVELSCRRR